MKALPQAGADEYDRTERGRKRIGTATGDSKRRTKVAGVVPDEESLLGRVRSILMDKNEERVTGRRYVSREAE